MTNIFKRMAIAAGLATAAPQPGQLQGENVTQAWVDEAKDLKITSGTKRSKVRIRGTFLNSGDFFKRRKK